jgi:predicted nucleic acid-binding protein
MTAPLLDTNVLLRHLLQDHSEHSPRATALVQRVENGELEVQLTELVLLETVFTLQRHKRVARDAIRQEVGRLLSLPGLLLPGKNRWYAILDGYALGGLSFVDSYLLEMMKRHNTTEIISFDRGFDNITAVTRIEP